MSVEPTNPFRGIIHRATGTIFGYQGWPTVTKDEWGVLYAVSSSFRTRHICPFGKTVLFISRDNGETWSGPTVINDSFLDDRDAGILYLGGGRFLVTWFCHPTKSYLGKYRDAILNSASPMEKPAVQGMLDYYPMLSPEDAHGGSYYMISEDYCVTWSKPNRIPVTAPHGPVRFDDNTLFYLGKEFCSDGKEPEDTLIAYASEDFGKTWSRRGAVPLPKGLQWSNFHEPHAVMLADGTILGAIRAENCPDQPWSSIYLTRSANGGRTWSIPEPTGIFGTPPHLLLHSSGAVILSYGRRGGVFGEYASVSYDQGRTWSEEYAIDTRSPDGDLGYPASVELSDGQILTVYYQKVRKEDGRFDEKPSILCTKWKLKK